MRVFVFDPGLTTGVVAAVVDDARSANEEHTLNQVRSSMELHHIKFPQEQYGTMKLWDCLCAFEPDIIVAEDFILFPDRSHPPDRNGTVPDRILAMMDLLMYLSVEGILEPWWARWKSIAGRRPGHHPSIVKQMPGERTIVTDSWLRNHQLWRTPGQIEGAVTGDKNHAMDALRHLVVWLRKYNTGKALG